MKIQENPECSVSRHTKENYKAELRHGARQASRSLFFILFYVASCHCLKRPLCLSTQLTLVSPFILCVGSKKEVICLLAALFPKHRPMPGIWCVPCKYLLERMIDSVIPSPDLPFL